jgi:hypothetical protein
MLVKCYANSLNVLDNFLVSKRLQRSIQVDGELSDLIVGKVYDVLAIEERDGGVWFFIHTVKESEYPYPYPSEFFEVLDTSLGRGWCVKFESTGDKSIIKRISFYEWANDAFFYEKLIDGDKDAKRAYRENAFFSNL